MGHVPTLRSSLASFLNLETWVLKPDGLEARLVVCGSNEPSPTDESVGIPSGGSVGIPSDGPVGDPPHQRLEGAMSPRGNLIMKSNAVAIHISRASSFITEHRVIDILWKWPQQ